MHKLIDKLMTSEDVESAYLLVAEQYNFRNHPYFIWMNDKATQEDFLQTQLSFRYAVESFSCALAACLSKISHLEKRIHLAENIEEEHGSGNLQNAHKYTFIQFLHALGVSKKQLNSPCSVGVHAFNESIRNFCLANCGAAGAALLGMIEYLYIDISAQIAHKMTMANWALVGKQSHYEAHEELDVEHAQELFDICTPSWKNSKHEIVRGMTLGAYYFWHLYLSMLDEVK